MRGNQGANALARAIDGRIRQGARRPDQAELGIIQADLSLKPDRFGVKIPPGDYLKPVGMILQEGDRVVMVWVNDGTDPVIVAKVG